MKKIKYYLLACLLATNLVSMAQADYEGALKKAKAESKLIFIDCYFTGCIPCAQMDEKVFPNAAVKATMEKDFVMLKVDIFKDKLGDTLKVQHILNGFPTFLVLNSKGELISNNSGYKDPGDLIELLTDAKGKNLQNKSLKGFAAKFNESDYPSFYLEFAKTRKGINQQIITAYADSLKNMKATTALMPFLISRMSAAKLNDAMINDYNTYEALYGDAVVQPLVDKALLEKMDISLKANKDAQAFDQFLKTYQGKFPAEIWKVNLQTLGDRYYLGMQKDTVGYLKFAIQHPVLYQYHFSALYSKMLVKNQLVGETGELFGKWADAIINEESSLELIKTAANFNKNIRNEKNYKKFMQMAIARSKKYQMPTAGLEEELATR